MENFIITLTYLVIGLALRRIPVFHDETGKILNLYVIYVALPALVLLKIPELTFSRNLLTPAIMPWVMLVLSCLLVLLLSKVLGWGRKTTGCLMLLVPMGNTSFLGIPMVKAFFGDQAIPYAVIYDQLGSFLALATYGSFIIALYGDQQNRPTVQGMAGKIIAFPPFIALVLAVMLKPFAYPPVAVTIFQTLAATLVPVVMIAVGFQLTLRLDRKITSQLCIGLSIKLVAAPLAALFLCRVAGLEGDSVRVSIFEAGMPPMISAAALAIMANLSPSLAAALAGAGIVLSFVTLPVLFQLL
ncbi:MAG: AEC family transporter [Thermodesulfovibrionales bacterium]